jgi:hypothetical protein
MLQKYLLAFVFGALVAGAIVYFAVARHSAPQPEPAPSPIESTEPQPPPATPPAAAAVTPTAPQHASVTSTPVRPAHKTKAEPEPPQSAESDSSAPPPEEPVQVAQAQPQPQPELPPPAPAPAPTPASGIDQEAQPAQPAAQSRPQPSNILRPDPGIENRDRTPHTVIIPAGTLVAVRLLEAISTDKQSEGDPFTATLDQRIVIDGFVIADRGAMVRGKIASLTRASRGQSHAAITLALTELDTTDGQKVQIRTDDSRQAAKANTKNAVTKIGVGTVLGAIIGAAAGGGQGAAIGAGAGGAAGGGAVLASKGEEVRLPSETRLSFKLAQAVTLTEKLK